MARKHPRSRSWDPVADWYIGWTGKRGGRHHRQTAIPTVIDLLNPQPGERILDIGCGPGALSSHIASAGALYTGVDASPRLLRFAKTHHGESGIFLIGDATRLPDIAALQPSSFDAAVFLLSIQDIEPLEDTIASSAWALDRGGRIVILMTHPCFRIPHESNWEWDDRRRQMYRRIDGYLTRRRVAMRSYGKGNGHTQSYHRPLTTYARVLAEHGFAIDRLVELPSADAPEPGPRQKAASRANQEIPLFLGLRAVKPD
jgi:SAM-dependent methyltransferase